MLAPDLLSVSDSTKRLRKLGWQAFSKAVLGASAAIGAKLGEKLVEAIFGGPDDEDDESEDPS